MSHATPKQVRVRVLGSGTSMGVPVIGCRCAVCTSPDPLDKRLRSSISIEADGRYLLVDCGIDFRQQMLAWPMPRIDAVLVTHTHSDHICGIDDLRIFNYLQRSSIPLHTSEPFVQELLRRYQYCFAPLQQGGGVPQIDLMPVEAGRWFEAAGVAVLPIEILHGVLPILGFRIGNFAYLTDCSGIPEASLGLLEGLDVLILSALRRTPHSTHFNLDQALHAVHQLRPKQTYFTHLADELPHAATNAQLPPETQLAYDGQEIVIG